MLSKMRYILTMIGILFMTLGLNSCYTDEGLPTDMEENLVINLDPDPGSTPVRTMGATYDFRVAIASRIPARGVDITVVYTQDSDNAVVFTQQYFTNTTPVPVTINNIPFDEMGTVTVTAVSRGSNTNTVSKTFKLVRK
jgi:hypothetical protein